MGMRRFAGLMIVTVVVAVACRAQSAESPVAPTTKRAPTTAPIAAVWYELGYPPPGVIEFRKLIVGVWDDGTVIWSSDRATGGKPYFVAKIDRSLIEKLLTSLQAVGLFDEPRGGHYGPDASITVIGARTGTKQQRLGSWHDPPSTRPLLVVNERGMGVVAPGEIKPKVSAKYARFLEVWAESRRLIESVVPEQSGRAMDEPIDDSVFGIGR